MRCTDQIFINWWTRKFYVVYPYQHMFMCMHTEYTHGHTHMNMHTYHHVQRRSSPSFVFCACMYMYIHIYIYGYIVIFLSLYPLVYVYLYRYENTYKYITIHIFLIHLSFSPLLLANVTSLIPKCETIKQCALSPVHCKINTGISRNRLQAFYLPPGFLHHKMAVNESYKGRSEH